MKPTMKRLILVILLPLAGCAIFDRPPDALESVADTLHTPNMNTAIKAAKPGEPRQETPPTPRS